jgi:hypothetical protein
MKDSKKIYTSKEEENDHHPQQEWRMFVKSCLAISKL